MCINKSYVIQDLPCLVRNSREDFLQLFYRLQLFSSENCFPKIAGHGQNKSKMTILKLDVDGFSYFSLISVFFFYSGSSQK